MSARAYSDLIPYGAVSVIHKYLFFTGLLSELNSLHQDLLSRAGMTVFRSARTRPKGEPKRKKSVISNSNFPIFPPSSIVELLDRLDPGSFLRTLECKLEQEQKIKTKFYSYCFFHN